MDTSGFYKREDQQSDQLLYGPNYVLHAEFELRRKDHAKHKYPVHGWTWFDSEEEARAALMAPGAPEPPAPASPAAEPLAAVSPVSAPPPLETVPQAAEATSAPEQLTLGLTGLVRARDEQGKYVGDDPSTPDVNEAWVPAPSEPMSPHTGET